MKLPMSPGYYMVYVGFLYLIVAFANLFYFQWCALEFIQMGYLLSLVLPLAIPALGRRIGLTGGFFW
jgi:hypothetical protein